MGELLKDGWEILTTGFYEMVIKNNSDWKTPLEKKKAGII